MTIASARLSSLGSIVVLIVITAGAIATAGDTRIAILGAECADADKSTRTASVAPVDRCFMAPRSRSAAGLQYAVSDSSLHECSTVFAKSSTSHVRNTDENVA